MLLDIYDATIGLLLWRLHIWCCTDSIATLTAGRVTTLWVKRPLSVSQQGRLSLPSLRGRLN